MFYFTVLQTPWLKYFAQYNKVDLIWYFKEIANFKFPRDSQIKIFCETGEWQVIKKLICRSLQSYQILRWCKSELPKYYFTCNNTDKVMLRIIALIKGCKRPCCSDVYPILLRNFHMLNHMICPVALKFFQGRKYLLSIVKINSITSGNDKIPPFWQIKTCLELLKGYLKSIINRKKCWNKYLNPNSYVKVQSETPNYVNYEPAWNKPEMHLFFTSKWLNFLLFAIY